MKQELKSKQSPTQIVDKDGDTWFLCGDGLYEVGSLGKRGTGSASLAYIEKHIGVRARIWR